MRNVCIIADDEDMREVLRRVVHSVGLKTEVYQTVESFLGRPDKSGVGCMVVEVELRGMKGAALLESLAGDGLDYPFFLLGRAHDALASTSAKRVGAVIIDKPFDARLLGQTIRNACERTGQ